MVPAPDPVRYAAAAGRFRAFFDELALAFVERDDVLLQIALALLAREHVLLTGPPGTAKSQLASAVFGRIVDETTGEPSLYARQITESTVQTDLIGPLDFKTLLETGRTEHFTDEGMLGAVHAFLDEVFDGRDMLLRSALNVLHERELKQGSRITRGRVECALMTSNRYLADVLESARETLLAFIDRIAFIAFVPRGFARREHLGLVLRRHVGGAERPALEALLTIQDLDALQAAVDAVHISDAVCDALAALLDLLDAELSAATRADPAFLPTRYLSTRTAVRSGQILRGICVHDRIFHAPTRPLEVLERDLAALRLHLVLAGPAADDIEPLRARETDAHERRQLDILRTEREIFERCLKKLPPLRIPPRPVATPQRPDPHGDEKKATPTAAADPPAAPAPDPLEERAVATLQSEDPKAISDLARELVPIARSGRPGAERAARLVERAVAALQEQALEAALAQGDRGRPRAGELHRLVRLAAAMDEGGATTQPIGRWLRGRALAKIDEMATFAPGASASDLEAAAGLADLWDDDNAPGGPPSWSAARFMTGAAHGSGQARDRAERRLADLEELHELRRRLLAQGTDMAEREASRAAWERAVAAAEDDVAALLDVGLREAVGRALSADRRAALKHVLAAIAPELSRLDAMSARLDLLRAEGAATGGGARGAPARGPAGEDAPAAATAGLSLKARVVGPRLGGLVAAALARADITDRASLLSELDEVLATLDRAGLPDVIAPRDWMTWSAAALLRADRELPEDTTSPVDYEGYRRLRAREQRIPNSYTLAEIALRVAPSIAGAPSPAQGARALAELAAAIPDADRARAVRLDLDRIERALRFLERWWATLCPADTDAFGAPEPALRAVIQSGIFRVLWDESALSRFAAEATLIAEVFPAHAGEAERMRARLEALEAATRKGALELLRRRADAAWNDTLGAPR